MILHDESKASVSQLCTVRTATRSRIVFSCAVQCSAVQWSTVQYTIVQYSIVQYSSVLCCVVSALYCSGLNWIKSVVGNSVVYCTVVSTV